MEFGPRLKQFRMRAKATQQELGIAIGSDVAYVSKLEKAGGPRPKRETVEAAADYLRLSPDEREELLLLAAHMPETVQELATRPAARQLLRSLSRLSDAQQMEIVDDLLRRLEPEGHGEDADPERGA